MNETDDIYGAGGKLQDGALPETIFAKIIYRGRRTIYLVKHATSGTCCPHLLNPWGVHWKESDAKKIDTHTGKHIYDFKEVSKTVFDMYIRFLETRNELYYVHAERNLD